ncbi:acyloxyacyl hydrolase [Chitinophaga nivalis]|uniref:Acyloxyacyl hydrolase n=1 Tax=Chitinophaga nivalis TaxID=2991709 RepID=A0ABT3IFW8_9BACT|nr:acyloxyacyl hydrolase [Chitinophaga nivalis]MCW3467457.1 acyloxyacyl hydrolase [Chitinophaga nivalis]MCW3482851.1 acyloxyacyl hydrolase [Chitinophaga nivalis]
MKHFLMMVQLWCTVLVVQAQDTTDLWQKAKQNPNLGRFKYLELKLHNGSHIYNGENMGEFLKHGYQSMEIRMGWQSTGAHDWQRALNYPSYGLGFYTGWIGEATILGNPSGLYGFFYAPLCRRKRHTFEAGLALGLTYDLNTYDKHTNPLNDAISSKVDVYFNLSIGGVWKASEIWDLTYGLDLTHFSNGRTHTPNLGLNMAGFNVGVRYHYNSIKRIVKKQIDSTYTANIRPTFIVAPLKPLRQRNEVSIYGAFGVVQHDSRQNTSAFYGTASLVMDYSRRYSHIASFGAGLDGFYDGSLGYTYEQQYGGRVRTGDKMLGGIHIGHALHLQRFDLVTQMGTYWYQRDDKKGSVFLRVGLRYNLHKNGFMQIGLKTLNGAKADWAEWGGGGKVAW